MITLPCCMPPPRSVQALSPASECSVGVPLGCQVPMGSPLCHPLSPSPSLSVPSMTQELDRLGEHSVTEPRPQPHSVYYCFYSWLYGLGWGRKRTWMMRLGSSGHPECACVSLRCWDSYVLPLSPLLCLLSPILFRCHLVPSRWLWVA